MQEYSLKLYKKLPIYRLLSSKGPKHNPIFKISVTINESKQFIGFGNSKKQAEQDAANNLLKSYKYKLIMYWKDEGYLLSKTNFDENSIIIETFTLNHGKYTGIVYGGSSRKQKKNFQIGNKILLNWRSKGD